MAQEIVTNKRFAAHVLLFDAQKWILRMIENCAPFVEKIYVAYSEIPWSVNPQARDMFKNTTDLSILDKSPYKDRIELIRGVWDNEMDQRNACLDRARSEGFDFLITHDADEFYTAEDYQKMLRQVAENPQYDRYLALWYTFWKNFDYVILNDEGSMITGTPDIVVNCHSDARFTYGRVFGSSSKLELDVICFHGSYVLTDEEVYRKINTWGHARDFDVEAWYRRKWLNWNEQTRNLHPLDPCSWRRAVKYTGPLPKEIQDFDSPPVTQAQLHGTEKLIESLRTFVEDRRCDLKLLRKHIGRGMPPWIKTAYRKIRSRP